MGWRLIGVHCASRESKLGLVRGDLHADGRLEITRATLGTAGESPAQTIASWLGKAKQHIVALDAPLGWPTELGRYLVAHRAGDPIAAPDDVLFHRHTAGFVQAATGRRPPAVAADAVAHTSRAALGLLVEVRALPRAPRLSMAWEQGVDSGVVEVFPAGTLAVRKLPSTGYRANTQPARIRRGEILEGIKSELEMDIRRDLLTENPDIFDALMCVIAGADFVRGQCQIPPEPERARREGWIWVRLRGQGQLF